MLHLLLDTGCVIAANKPGERYFAACAELVEMHDRGAVRLSVATAFEYDQETAGRTRTRLNAEFLREHRIDRVAGPLALDVSLLGRGDELVDGETGARLNDIRAVMRPPLPGVPFDRRKELDVHHVSACVYAGLDAIVTIDKDDILSKKQELADLGLKVLDPDEAVALVAEGRNGPTGTA